MLWKGYKLDSLLNIQNGFAFNSKKFSSESGIPLIRIRDISNGVNTVINYDGDFDEKYIVKSGDFLIGMDGEFRCYEWKGNDALLNQRVCRLQDFTADLYPKFLFYGINKYLKDIEDVTNFTTVKHISAKQIKDIEIPLPPIPEQKRIVALLDTVFADLEQARTKTEQNLKNARELFDSYLQQVFSQKGEGWVESKLGDLLHISSSKRVYAKDWTDSGVPFFGGKEIVKLAKYGKAVSNAFISEEKYMDYASKYDMPQAGDILMTARGTIGVGYIVKEGDKFYYKDGNIISLRQKKPTNPDFILYAFKSHKIIDQIKELTGTTVSHLPLNKAKEIFINIPSYQVQNELVVQIKEVESNIQQVASIYEEKLTSLDELKKSILQKAFSGELTHK